MCCNKKQWTRGLVKTFLFLLNNICVMRQDLDGKKSINSRAGKGGKGRGRVTLLCYFVLTLCSLPSPWIGCTTSFPRPDLVVGRGRDRVTWLGCQPPGKDVPHPLPSPLTWTWTGDTPPHLFSLPLLCQAVDRQIHVKTFEFFTMTQSWHFWDFCTKLTSRVSKSAKIKLPPLGIEITTPTPPIRIPTTLPTQLICQSSQSQTLSYKVMHYSA